MINTDCVLSSGNVYKAVQIDILSVSGPVENNAALQQFTVTGAGAPSSANNNGGEYGWISFGKSAPPPASGIYYFPAQKVTYFKQSFLPPDSNCSALRVWMKKNVVFVVTVTPISQMIGVIDGIVTQLLPLLKPGGIKITTTPAGPQLPAPIP
jgi:hypothetical protein